MYTYNLGFEVMAADLPEGRIRFRVSGPTATRLAEPDGQLEDPNATKMQLEVQCSKLDQRSREIKHQLNSKWKLILEGDCGSNFLFFLPQEM